MIGRSTFISDLQRAKGWWNLAVKMGGNTPLELRAELAVGLAVCRR